MGESFYSATCVEDFVASKSGGEEVFDVCIVGGGIVALSCAQALNNSGVKVAVVEKERIFSGASGVNGGFVAPGYALGIDDLEKRVGIEHARKLFEISIGGVEKIKRNILSYDIKSASVAHGKIDLLRYKPSRKEVEYPERMRSLYGYEVKPMERGELEGILNTESYCYGFYHSRAFHIHPLNYGFGLARSIQAEGVVIYEDSEVESIRKTNDGYALVCAGRTMSCKEVVVCTGGSPGKDPEVIRKSVLPISTYVVTSERNDEIPEKYIKTRCALGDNRRASDYYRVVDGSRVLWGGRITAFPTSRKKGIEDQIRQDIRNVFPGLSGLKFSYSWKGVMGYATHKMPCIGRLDSGVWYCTAFGGRGLGSGTACGEVLAKALLGDEESLGLFKEFGLKNTYGFLGKIAVEATYKKYIIKDRLEEKNKS